jgi:Flp pilus assembly pilin Flp
VCNDGNGDSSGHVRVYGNISGNWTQIGSDIDGEAAYDYSGNTVSLSSDGSIVAIGADCNFGNDSNSGYVRVYKNTSGTWTQIGSDINGEEDGDRSGISISLSNDGSIVAIGAHSNDGNGSDAGQVRIYKNISGTWTQVGSDIDGEAAGDGSGYSVSLSSDGSIVAIGARNNDGNGSNAGHVRVYSWVGTTSVLNILSNVSISLFPNPTSGSVHIQTSPELIGAGYRVTTNYGSEVLQGEIIGFDTQLDLKDFAEGVYFINVGDKLQQSLKVMKR